MSRETVLTVPEIEVKRWYQLAAIVPIVTDLSDCQEHLMLTPVEVTESVGETQEDGSIRDVSVKKTVLRHPTCSVIPCMRPFFVWDKEHSPDGSSWYRVLVGDTNDEGVLVLGDSGYLSSRVAQTMRPQPMHDQPECPELDAILAPTLAQVSQEAFEDEQLNDPIPVHEVPKRRKRAFPQKRKGV